MNDYIIVQLIFCAAVLLEVGYLLCRYRRRIGRPAENAAYQYRFYKLRDRAIGLVADRTIEEQDAEWQLVYNAINNSAKLVAVKGLRSPGPNVSRVLCYTPPPSAADLAWYDSLPPSIQILWIDYVRTVVQICWQASIRLRIFVTLNRHSRRTWAILRRLHMPTIVKYLRRLRPSETLTYEAWEHTQRRLEASRQHGQTAVAGSCS